MSSTPLSPPGRTHFRLKAFPPRGSGLAGGSSDESRLAGVGAAGPGSARAGLARSSAGASFSRHLFICCRKLLDTYCSCSASAKKLSKKFPTSSGTAFPRRKKRVGTPFPLAPTLLSSLTQRIKKREMSNRTVDGRKVPVGGMLSGVTD